MSNKARRVEFRIVKMLCEYSIPEGITEKEANKLIDEINNPEEINLPRTVVKIDTEHSQLLSIAINENEQGEPCPASEAFGFLTQSLVDRFPLEDLANQLALEDIREAYSAEIKECPAATDSPVFIKLVADRKDLYINRITKTLNQMFDNLKPEK